MEDVVISSEMIRGHLDAIILLSLASGDRDSNEIRDDISDKSGNKYNVKQGTFYSAMTRLSKQNYIKEYRSSAADGIRRKYYSLTDKGRRYLEKNRSEWKTSKDVIDDLIDTPSDYVKKELPRQNDTDVDFENFKILASDTEEFRIESASDETDYLNKLGEEVLNDLNSEFVSSDALSGEQIAVYDGSDVTDDEIVDDKVVSGIYQENLFGERFSVETDETETDTLSEEDDSPNNNDNITIEEIATEYSDPAKEPEISEESVDTEEPVGDEINIEDFLVSNLPEETLFSENDITEIADSCGSEYAGSEEKATEEDAAALPVSVSETESEKIDIISENPKIEEKPIIIFASDDSDYDIPAQAAPRAPVSDEKPVSEQREAQDTKVEEKDDFLYIDDDKPIQREYKSLLNKLFPKDEVAERPVEKSEPVYERPTPEPQPQPQTIVNNYYYGDDQNSQKYSQIDIDSYEKEPAGNRDEYEQPRYVQTGDYENAENAYQAENARNNTEAFDFSDLYAMANREGFKVKTSSATNKRASKRILINKLRCHSSLLFYGILFLEMLVLYLAFGSVLGWNIGVTIAIPAVLFVFPLVMLVIWLVSGEYSVSEISSFRNAMEVGLIIAFQAIIIILGVALFISVDFDNFRQVLTAIILPCILAINIPLYVIFKYLLLGSGKYFVE